VKDRLERYLHDRVCDGTIRLAKARREFRNWKAAFKRYGLWRVARSSARRDTARAMSQENVELAYRASDAINRRDLDALLALTDADMEFGSLTVAVEGDLRGHDGVRRWLENVLDVWPDYKIEVVEARDWGDLTISAVRTRGHGAGSDAPMDMTLWQVARWRRGKCVWLRNFYTREEALEAVGLSE
jgi:ketosteroid isomerase-like protein